MKRLLFMTLCSGVLGVLAWNFHSSVSAQTNHNHEGGILGHQAPEWPDMPWIDAEGNSSKPLRLGLYKGKWLYLYFFQAWCPGCHSHGFPALQRMTKEFKGDDRFAAVAIQTVFEGFSSNSEGKVKSIQKKYKLAIPMGHDAGTKEKSGSQLMGSYRSRGTPWAILIDPQGKVVFNNFHADSDALIKHIKKALNK